MFHLINLCSLCLANDKKITSLSSIDSNANDMIQRIIPEFVQQSSGIQRKLCDDCLRSLIAVVEFRRKCLANIIIFNEYVRKLELGYRSYEYKYLGVTTADIKLDIKKEINEEIILDEDTCFVEDNLHTNYCLQVDDNIKQENSYNRESDEDDKNDQKSDVLDIKKEINEEIILDEDTCSLENVFRTNFLKVVNNIKQEHSYNKEPNEEQVGNVEKNYVSLRASYGSDFGKSDKPEIQDVDSEERLKRKKCGEESPNCMRNTDSPKYRKRQIISARNKSKQVRFAKKSYACNTCHKSFRFLSELNRHERIHTGEKPYPCGYCGKRFTQLSSVKLHQQRGHNNEKPYACNICQKRFLYESSLESHNLSHSNKRAFECNICGKWFKTPDYLRKHQITHVNSV